MRLWHQDLLPYLPKQQLLGQWRECVAIAKALAEDGTPNHVLVNRILDYPSSHFFAYCVFVQSAMARRGFKTNPDTIQVMDDRLIEWSKKRTDAPAPTAGWDIFTDWFTPRYLKQCLYNLQEKYDCGAISQEEWDVIEAHFGDLLKERKH